MYTTLFCSALDWNISWQLMAWHNHQHFMLLLKSLLTILPLNWTLSKLYACGINHECQKTNTRLRITFLKHGIKVSPNSVLPPEYSNPFNSKDVDSPYYFTGTDYSLPYLFPILVHSSAQKFNDKSFFHHFGYFRANKLFKMSLNKRASENLCWCRERKAWH